MKKLTEQKIQVFIANNYDGDARDFIAVFFGSEPSSIDWKKLEKTNGFPYRQLQTVKEALANPNSGLVSYADNKSDMMVKRDTFFEWASEQWNHYPETQAAQKIWRHYKKKASVSHKKSKKRKVYDFVGKQLAIFYEENPAFFDLSAGDMKSALREKVRENFKYAKSTVDRYTREGLERHISKYKNTNTTIS